MIDGSEKIQITLNLNARKFFLSIKIIIHSNKHVPEFIFHQTIN